MYASRVLRLVAVAALVLVAAIAIGAASRPHSVELSLSAPQLGEVAVLAVLVLAGAVGVLMGSSLVSIWILPRAGVPRQGGRSRLPWGVQVVLFLLPLMAIAFLIASAGHLSGAGRQPPGMLPVHPVVATDSGAAGGADLFLACLGVALAGFLVAAVLFGRARPVTLVGTAPQESVTAILDEGLGALLAEHDPRKAVIAAYVAMERSMDRKGWARRPHEAPTEYLARVLRVAPSRAQDLDELVSLYEFARFSEHIVTSAMRDAAVDSVRRLRAELAEPV
ncbi:MAG: DUF4129 domain-containing protein [Candidatus Limnocylindrales bacterium]|jgi:hypothetical protein